MNFLSLIALSLFSASGTLLTVSLCHWLLKHMEWAKSRPQARVVHLRSVCNLPRRMKRDTRLVVTIYYQSATHGAALLWKNDNTVHLWQTDTWGYWNDYIRIWWHSLEQFRQRNKNSNSTLGSSEYRGLDTAFLREVEAMEKEEKKLPQGDDAVDWPISFHNLQCEVIHRDNRIAELEAELAETTIENHHARMLECHSELRDKRIAELEQIIIALCDGLPIPHQDTAHGRMAAKRVYENKTRNPRSAFGATSTTRNVPDAVDPAKAPWRVVRPGPGCLRRVEYFDGSEWKEIDRPTWLRGVNENIPQSYEDHVKQHNAKLEIPDEPPPIEDSDLAALQAGPDPEEPVHLWITNEAEAFGNATPYVVRKQFGTDGRKVFYRQFATLKEAEDFAHAEGRMHKHSWVHVSDEAKDRNNEDRVLAELKTTVDPNKAMWRTQYNCDEQVFYEEYLDTTKGWSLVPNGHLFSTHDSCSKEVRTHNAMLGYGIPPMKDTDSDLAALKPATEDPLDHGDTVMEDQALDGIVPCALCGATVTPRYRYRLQFGELNYLTLTACQKCMIIHSMKPGVEVVEKPVL